jgi:hypothetical protein
VRVYSRFEPAEVFDFIELSSTFQFFENYFAALFNDWPSERVDLKSAVQALVNPKLVRFNQEPTVGG